MMNMEDVRQILRFLIDHIFEILILIALIGVRDAIVSQTKFLKENDDIENINSQ